HVSGETGMTVDSALSGYTTGFWILLGGGIADYAGVYGRVFGYGLAVAVAFALARPRGRRLMHGVH
ncbi:MAG TPA: hypothetical protein VFM52_03415, partial [Rhodanobacter sp.]|nr:hypothetical protein [Rhodanobacter sp.]